MEVLFIAKKLTLVTGGDAILWVLLGSTSGCLSYKIPGIKYK
ncbi:MAG: hypothetical protein ACOH15_05875 [Acetobacterium sp.]